MRSFTSFSISSILQQVSRKRGFLFSLLLIGALLAFEIFNYSTTDFALTDLLGELRFAGLRWATILAIAFCGIDFAGIARLFTPESGPDERAEIWYLFGAWLLAATMNAFLTWWGVSIALLYHDSLGNAVIARETLLKTIPVFVAMMVWLSRVLIIGTFSVAGERLFNTAQPNHQTVLRRKVQTPNRTSPTARPVLSSSSASTPARPDYGGSYNPSSKPVRNPDYQPVPMVAKPASTPEKRWVE